ncbi:MAG: cyclic nucleotide-binding domain-containing protein [Actinomycetota bacterium]
MEPQRVSHSLVQTLCAIPDFSTLDDDTLLVIVGESMNLFWREGSRIFEQGTQGVALYVILSGRIAIHDGDSVEGHVVAELGPNDYFGELSLLLNTTHSKTATALSDCELLVLPKAAFVRLLDEHPKLQAHFEQVLEEGGHRQILSRGTTQRRMTVR